MIKAILFIWLGAEMSMTKFDSLAECKAARSAIVSTDHGFGSNRLELSKCISYKVPNQ